MRRTSAFLILLLVLFQAGPAVAAEVTVRARVDRTTVSPGESLQLEVTVSNGKGEVDLSALTDFKVLSGGTSSSVQIINGRMSREQTHTMLLIAQRKGIVTIPALNVEVDGKTYTTEPITITVSDSTASGGSADKEAWVTAEVSNLSPFQGQQITYTFRLTNRVQINDAKFQPPEFKGFNAKEIEERRSYRKLIDGRDHMITEVYFVLTPLSAGLQTIDPAVLQVGIVRPGSRRSRSPFDDFFNRGTVEPKVLQTETIRVQVRPLPPLEAGRTFSGLVGRFDLTAAVESTELQVGDSATVTVTVQGKGNVMDAQSPDLKIPPAFKHYADNAEEAIRTDREGASGKKIFRTALVPVQSGTFTLPPVQLVYFDINESAYRTLTAAIPSLTVRASDAARSTPVAVTPGPLKPLKKRVAFTGRDILPPKESLDAVVSRSPIAGTLFICSIAAPAIVFLILMWAQRLIRRDLSPMAAMKTRARRALKQARNNDAEDVLTLLYQALTAAILAAAGRTGEALTWKEARSLLKAAGKSEEEAGRAADLLSRIESHKFSGSTLNEAQKMDLLDQTQTMVGKLAR